MDRLILDRREVDSVLNRALVGRIALSLKDQPYVVPLNFVYTGGKIYFHSANEGQLYTYLKANNQVCFEVDEPGETIPNADPCKFSFRYKSIIAFGKARFLEKPPEKIAILKALVEKYDKNKVATKEVTTESLGDVEVLEITIEHMTGKTNAP
ncbi:MAG TPA: pyridoxamine 5'-phosphate oxidase family protein [Candidatus Acidoferrales bacterium]|nr:pyridoxamine 5'-phosphate oxidase family protein [Candidatus Acidoferrales bacterium]